MRRLVTILLCVTITLTCTSATTYPTEHRMQPKMAQHTITPHTSQINATRRAMYSKFTERDVILVAKTIYGEAGSDWITYEEKACVAWVICNRVDDPRWPDTIEEVVTADNQFHGYSERHTVTDECYSVAKDVLIRWSLENLGYTVERELGPTVTAFYGDGVDNHFYEY